MIVFHKLRLSIYYVSVLLILSTTIFPEEIKEITSANTASLETDIHTPLINQTIERLKQLNKAITLQQYPYSDESPYLDYEKFILKNGKSDSPIISRTSEPLLKEQLVSSKNINISTEFEDIFLILSDEMRLKSCKKIYSENPESFIQKIIHYLGKGNPEQALMINQILPYLKNELEESLFRTLLQKNFHDAVEKRTIIYILGRIKSEKSAPLLWDEIQLNPSEEIQYTCVQALANMPHSLSLEQWVQLIQSQSVSVALTSAYALVEYGGSSAEEYIRRILLGEFPVSQRVLDYLTDRISNYPVDILVPFAIEVMSKNPGLAQNFSSILTQKTGANLGPNPQLWANWWKEYLNSLTPPAESTESTQSSADNLIPPDVKIHQPRIRKR